MSRRRYAARLTVSDQIDPASHPGASASGWLVSGSRLSARWRGAASLVGPSTAPLLFAVSARIWRNPVEDLCNTRCVTEIVGTGTVGDYTHRAFLRGAASRHSICAGIHSASTALLLQHALQTAEHF